MGSKSLASTLSLRSINKIKVLYSLGSLFSIFFFLQVIENVKEEYTNDFARSSVFEKEYRKRFNLMNGPAVVGEECTLGNLLYVLCFKI